MYEPSEQKDWLARLGGIILAIVVGGIVFALVRGGAGETIEYAQASPGAVEAEIEKDEDFARLYGAMKRHFPGEYQEFLDRISSSARSGATETDMHNLGFSYMRDFMVRQTGHIARAPRRNIFAIRDANVRAAEYLSKENVSQCAHFTMDGLRPTDRPSPGATRVLTNATLTMVEAAAAGKNNSDRYEQPTEQDWQMLVNSMRSKGVTEAEIGHLSNGTYAMLSDSDQCRLGLNLLHALAEIEDPVSERIFRGILAAAGA